MSTPDPIAPPPKRNTNKWLLGCLIAFVVLVVLGLAVTLLGVYAAKKELDGMTTDARKVYDDARKAAAVLEPPPPIAPALAQGAEARMRLNRAAGAIVAAEDLSGQPCPPDSPAAAPSVDAQWLIRIVDGLPKQAVGTPWFRHPLFATAAEAGLAADASEDGEALALIALDRGLGESGAIAIIHTTSLVEPRLVDGKPQIGAFDGFVQLIGYPDGETICIAPIRVRTAAGEDFQQRFRAAGEAALGK